MNIPIRVLSKFAHLFDKETPQPTLEIKPVSPLKNLIDSPEDYKIEAYFEEETLVVKLKPKTAPTKYRIDGERVKQLQNRVKNTRRLMGSNPVNIERRG